MEEKTVIELVRGRPVYIVQEVDSVLDAVRYMTEYRVEAVPVLSGGDLVGIFSGQDLMTRVVAMGMDPASVKVGEVMTGKVAVLGADSTCADALGIMKRLRIRHLPVMDGRRLIGCISLSELNTVEAEPSELRVEFVDEAVERDRRPEMSESRKSLVDQVRAIPGGEHLYMCYSCGTCVASCMIQKLEPEYNPRRLIQKVIRGLEPEAFEDKTTWLCSACELCYPACPQEVHISSILSAVRELAVQAGHQTHLKTAVVDESTCVACGLCVEVCPYEAVNLVDKRVMGQNLTLASVDANRCMACGLCAASCRSSSIGLEEGFSNQAVMDDLWGWLQETEVVADAMAEAAAWSTAVVVEIAE